MLRGKVRLRGFALYPMAAWVNWEPDGARGKWQVLPSGLFPRPGRGALMCMTCEAVVIEPRSAR
jgi:hypothetical protein